MAEVMQNGDTFTWVPQFRNNGASDEPAAEVQLTLPTGVSLITSSVSHGSFNSFTLLWTVGIMASGDVITGTFGFEVTDITQLGDITAVISGNNTDPNAGNNTKTETVSLGSDPVATAVADPYGCLCGDVSTNDTPCDKCDTKYKVVVASEVNLTIDSFDEDTGQYRVTLTDITSNGSFQYYIQCECDGLPAYVQNTVTVTIPAYASAFADTHWFNTDQTQDADRAHDQAGYDTDLTNVSKFSFTGDSPNRLSVIFEDEGANPGITLFTENAGSTSITQYVQSDVGVQIAHEDSAGDTYEMGVDGTKGAYWASDTGLYTIDPSPPQDDTVTKLVGLDAVTGQVFWRDVATIGTDTNFVNTDLTATTNRSHNFANNDLSIINIGTYTLGGDIFILGSGSGTTISSSGPISSSTIGLNDNTVASGKDVVLQASSAIVQDSAGSTYYYGPKDGTNIPTTDNGLTNLLVLDSVDGRIYKRTVASLGIGSDTNLTNASNTNPSTGVGRVHDMDTGALTFTGVGKMTISANDFDFDATTNFVLDAVEDVLLTAGDELKLDSDQQYYLVTAPTTDNAQTFFLTRDGGTGRLYLRTFASLGLTDTSFFNADWTQTADRNHNQDGYDTNITGIKQFQLTGENTNTYINLEDAHTPGVETIKLNVDDFGSNNNTDLTLLAASGILTHTDGSDTSSIEASVTNGVTLDSTTRKYYLGDASKLPTEDNTLDDFLVIDATDGRVYTRGYTNIVESVQDDLKTNYNIDAFTTSTVLNTITSATYGDAFFVVPPEEDGRYLNGVIIRTFDGQYTSGTSTAIIYHQIDGSYGSVAPTSVKTFTGVDVDAQSDQTLSTQLAAGDIIFCSYDGTGTQADIKGLSFTITIGTTAPG